MKKLIFSCITLILFSSFIQANEIPKALKKGKWMIETNLSPYSSIGTTGFLFNKTENTQVWAIGGETGYFISDRLALKAGIGYSKNTLDVNIEDNDFSIDNKSFSYKIGAKYYIINAIPVQIDFGGIKANQNKQNFVLGGQIGYALFINHNIIIEPQIRYSISPDNNVQNDKTLSARIGFSLHF